MHACAHGKPTVASSFRVYQNGRLLRARDRICTDFNYSPTGHLSRHGRARVRALFIRARLTVNSISPRCYRGEIFVFFSPRARKRSARAPLCLAPALLECRRVCMHAVTRAQARARISTVVTFCLPHRASRSSLSLSLSLPCLAAFLPTPSLANAT